MPQLTDNGNGTTTVSAFLVEADVTTAFANDELIQILDDPDDPTGDLNTDLLNQLIGRVSATINESVARKYALPLIVPTADAVNVGNAFLNCGLALFRWRAMENKTHIQEAFRGAKAAYDEALQFLENVRNGVAYLGTSATLPGSPARTDNTVTSGHKGTFERDRMKGW